MDWGERIGRRLKLRDLHILLTVAQCGSMTKAAREMSVSNPVVSKAVTDLEHTLGVRLLDRSPRGVELTIFGQALLDRGVIAFDELRQAVKHVEFLSDPTQGNVTIGSSIAIAMSFVATLVSRVSGRYPGLRFQLLATEAAAAYRALEERRVDLLVARIVAPEADLQHMNVLPLYKEKFVVVAGAENPWALRRKVKLGDLIHETWALPPPDSHPGSIVLEAFRSEGLDMPQTTVFTTPYPARRALAATGRFLSIAANLDLMFPVRDIMLKALPIELPTTRRPIAILTLKNRTVSPVAQLLIDQARAMAKSWVQRK